jgi:hypothetical protein
MSTAKNPKELIDRYLQAVRFWLPKSENQEDLLAELGEDLHSQIEEKEAALGRTLDVEEASETLKKCGPPMVVAARMGPQRHLIGPALYPIYTFVLKMVLLWIMVPVFLFIIGPANVVHASSWQEGVLATIGTLWSGMFVSAGTITLVFAILERTQAHVVTSGKWDPRTLPPLENPERKPSLLRTACELFFATLGLVWLLLLPHSQWLILGPPAAFLKGAPGLHAFYLPVVALSALVIVRLAVMLARPDWPRFPLASRLAHEVLMFGLLTVVLNYAGTPQAGDWHPFVVLAEATRASGQFAKVSAIVNLSILISLLIWWFALGVGIIVHAWQLIQSKRKDREIARQTASLQAR